MAQPPVRAVFFDIGNVLVRFDLTGLLKDFALSAGSSPWRVARLVWSRRLVDDVESGRLSGPALHVLVHEQTGFRGDYDEFRRLWCGRFKLDERVAGVFRKAAKKTPAYLLSNTNPIHWEHIKKRYAFAREARGAALSFEVGSRKPERAIYAAAAALAGVEAAECLFVDDLAENVAGAQKAGMQALLFKTPARLERDLAGLGLL